MAQVEPPLSEKELIDMFVDTLQSPYFNRLVSSGASGGEEEETNAISDKRGRFLQRRPQQPLVYQCRANDILCTTLRSIHCTHLSTNNSSYLLAVFFSRVPTKPSKSCISASTCHSCLSTAQALGLTTLPGSTKS